MRACSSSNKFFTWNKNLFRHPKSIRGLTPLQLLLAAVLILAGQACGLARQPSPAQTAPAKTSPAGLAPTPAGNFDYFVLALSWSPDYCAANGPNDPQECALGQKLGFVLHGLWPQYNQGYPSDCSTAPLPAQLKSDFAGLYPNDNLFEHEWSKHGTCAGLDPRAYLELAQRLKQSVLIPNAYQAPSQPFRAGPADLRQGFEASNPGFAATSFELSCSGSGRYLKEVYICFAKDGQAAACGADVHKGTLKSCAAPDFLVRSVR